MRKKKQPEHVNHERWLVSYADFITLLFAFFTTMYAISTVDAKKMGRLVLSMKAAFDPIGMANAKATSMELLASRDELVAVASDYPVDAGVPRFELDDIDGIVDWIYQKYVEPKAKAGGEAVS